MYEMQKQENLEFLIDIEGDTQEIQRLKNAVQLINQKFIKIKSAPLRPLCNRKQKYRENPKNIT